MYNPKIYIRDYGVPDHRLLAFWGGYSLAAFDAGLLRDLIMHAENPFVGEEFLLLEGDEQSGVDTLDLTGTGNDRLVLSVSQAMRFYGSDANFQYSNISDFPSWAYEFTEYDAGLIRALFLRTEAVAFSETTQAAGLLRSLLMPAATRSYGMTTFAANLTRSLIVEGMGAAFEVTASDADLLRQLPMAATVVTFTTTGYDAALLRDLMVTASGGSFSATFIDANISTDSFELLSGDQQSGSDAKLLSGDQQSDEDLLLLS